MPEGRQHIRWDAAFFGGTLGPDLLERFGPAGVTLFLAFVCACKRNPIRGRICYFSDADCMAQLGLWTLDLVDQEGEPFTLDEFWQWLGKRKQTRRIRRGHSLCVISSRWEQWQKDWKREDERDKKAAQRAGTDPQQTSNRPSTDLEQTLNRPRTDPQDVKSTRGQGDSNGRIRGGQEPISQGTHRGHCPPDCDCDCDVDKETTAEAGQDPWDEKNFNNQAVLSARTDIRRRLFALPDAVEAEA